MSDYVLSCCSTADVTRELLEERGIAYAYFNYQLDGQMLKDDFGQTNSPAQLYSKMLAGADARPPRSTPASTSPTSRSSSRRARTSST